MKRVNNNIKEWNTIIITMTMAAIIGVDNFVRKSISPPNLRRFCELEQ